MDSGAGNLLQLTHGEWGEKGADCCLDGKWVVHDAMGGNNNHLWRVPIGGGESEPLIEMNAHFPVVSPDSTMVAFNYFGANDVPRTGVAVLSSHDGSLKRFPIQNFDSTDPLIDYRPMGWTADSRGLLFLREVQNVSNIWMQSLDGGPPRQFTHFREGHIFNFALSRDGKQIALARGRLASDVILIRNVP